ncbi:MAG: hypothetical protein Q9214_003759, partial [Letrouitia sp. 1 TL-2023]
EMHSFAIFALVLPALVNIVVSQSIDPSTVDNDTRDTPMENRCDDATLSYSCVCSNGQQPNASEYSQTIPFYECTEAANQCVNRCPKTDSNCQSQCRTAHPCGAQNPTRVNTSTITTMSATGMATATGDSAEGAGASTVYTGFGAASTSGSADDSGSVHSIDARALALGFGRSYGLTAVFLGVSAGFVFML